MREKSFCSWKKSFFCYEKKKRLITCYHRDQTKKNLHSLKYKNHKNMLKTYFKYLSEKYQIHKVLIWMKKMICSHPPHIDNKIFQNVHANKKAYGVCEFADGFAWICVLKNACQPMLISLLLLFISSLVLHSFFHLLNIFSNVQHTN